MWWYTPVIPAAWEAKAGGWRVQSQPQQKRDAKQLSETQSLNKIFRRTGDVAQWLSVPGFNPWSKKKEKKKIKRMELLKQC